MSYPNPTGTINQGSFNVSDERGESIAEALATVTAETLNDYENYDDFYERGMRPIAVTPDEELYIAFCFGKLVAHHESHHRERMNAVMERLGVHLTSEGIEIKTDDIDESDTDQQRLNEFMEDAIESVDIDAFKAQLNVDHEARNQ